MHYLHKVVFRRSEENSNPYKQIKYEDTNNNQKKHYIVVEIHYTFHDWGCRILEA
jgi:hypothetical protein